MLDPQIKALIEYITGTEAAIFTLANIVSKKCDIPKKEMAESFRNTAAIISKESSGVSSKALNDIANMLEGLEPDPKKTLLRLIQGGK